MVKAIECLSQRLCTGSIPDNYLQRKVPQVILSIIALNSRTKAESSTSFASRIPSISPGDTFGQPAAVMVRTLKSVLPNNPSLNKTSSDKNDERTKGDWRRPIAFRMYVEFLLACPQSLALALFRVLVMSERLCGTLAFAILLTVFNPAST